MNGYSGQFGDEEASMLWFDEKGLHISRKIVQEFLKIPEARMERLTKWTDLNCFLRSDRRWAYLFLFLFEFEASLVLKPTVRSKT